MTASGECQVDATGPVKQGASGILPGWELGAVGLAVLGVLVRCRCWASVFTDAGVVMPGVDPYYHLWRAVHLAASLPGLPLFDPFISFPAGAPIPWPPGFDLLVGLPVLFGGGAGALAAWGSVLVTLLGGVAVYLVWRLGRRLFDPATGLVAAGLLALLPGAVGFSELGRVDHHALVAPVTLGLVLAFLASLDAGTLSRRIVWGWMCGLLAGVMVASWIVTPALYFVPVPFTLFLLGWTGEAQRAKRTAWCVLVPAAAAVLAIVLLVADLGALPFSLYQPSWFTVSLFILMAAVVVPRFYRLRVTLPVWTGLLAVLLLLVLLVPGSIEPVAQALRVARGEDPSYRMAWESSQLFLFRGVFTLWHQVSLYTHLLLLAPFAWGVLLWKNLTRRPADPGGVCACVFIGLGLVLLLLQERFGEFAAPAMALLFGWSLVAGGRSFVAFARGTASRSRTWLWGALLVAGLGLALSPLVTEHLAALRARPPGGPYQLAKFAALLARTTPSPRQPGQPPRYGILTGWGQSHPLLWYARRPVMVSSFATPQALRWNRVGFRMLLSPDEETTVRLARSHRIRYLVVTAMHGQANDMAAIAGIPTRFVREEVNTGDGKISIAYQPLPPFTHCVLSRMYVADGSSVPAAGIRHRALSRLRLHLESEGTTQVYGLVLPRFKAFEVVEGARLSGTTEPRAPVRAEVRLRTNTGRTFVYLRDERADSTGRYGITVPYSSRTSGAPVTALGPYRVTTQEGTWLVDVSEAQVRGGVVVPVDMVCPAE